MAKIECPKSRTYRGAYTTAYMGIIFLRVAVEVLFISLQVLLYGTKTELIYKCTATPPCPNTVDCFNARPDEKSFVMNIMLGNY